MTQEDKELLLKDLCARLPYGVKVDIPDLFNSTKNNIEVLKEIFCGDDGEFRCNDSGILIKCVKPYLFPLSSMTEEQKKGLENLGWNFDNFEIHNVSECLGTYREYVAHSDCFNLIDWFNKNHFDYRGLIEKGLAIDATGLNIK